MPRTDAGRTARPVAHYLHPPWVERSILTLLASPSGCRNGQMKKFTFGRSLIVILELAGILLLAACAVSAPPAVKPPEIPVFPSPPDEARFIYERTLYSSADVVKEDKNAGLKR